MIAIAVLAAAAAGTYFWLAAARPTGPDQAQESLFRPLVKGCAETDEGQAAKTRIAGGEHEAEITAGEGSIEYSRAISHLCCRQAELEKETEGFKINIYENWSGIGCRCMCFSEIGANLENLPAGEYEVSVYERGIEPGEEEKPMEERLIISENIAVK